MTTARQVAKRETQKPRAFSQDRPEASARWSSRSLTPPGPALSVPMSKARGLAVSTHRCVIGRPAGGGWSVGQDWMVWWGNKGGTSTWDKGEEWEVLSEKVC